MINLYAQEGDTLAAEVEQALRDMSAAYRRIAVKSGEPFVEEGSVRVEGEEELRRYVKETGRLLKLWSSFQSDACEIDEDGEVC